MEDINNIVLFLILFCLLISTIIFFFKAIFAIFKNTDKIDNKENLNFKNNYLKELTTLKEKIDYYNKNEDISFNYFITK